MLHTIPVSATALCSVDLQAIRSNYRRYQEKLIQGTSTGHRRVGAVVKANAYGLGAEAITKALLREGCRDFFVAYLSEAVELRATSLSTKQISPITSDPVRLYVLAGLLEGMEPEFAQHQLIPCLGTRDEIARWNRYAQRVGKKLPANLHVDTGMARTGLEASEWLSIEQQSFDALDVQYLMSHFASADEVDHPQTTEQLVTFRRVVDHARKLGLQRFSLSNSWGGAYTSHDDCQLARVGLGVYGLAMPKSNEDALACAFRLSGRCIGVRTIEKDQAVGYNARYRAKSSRERIATLSLGHFDGLSQVGTNSVVFRHGPTGSIVPSVGTISMDLTTVDVSSIPHSQIAPGDWFDYVWSRESAYELAKSHGSSVYEVITHIGSRHCRVYEND